LVLIVDAGVVNSAMSLASEAGRTVELQDFQKFAIWPIPQALWRRRGLRDPYRHPGMIARILSDATIKASKSAQRYNLFYPLVE
jgi:hypothetical protein